MYHHSSGSGSQADPEADSRRKVNRRAFIIAAVIFILFMTVRVLEVRRQGSCTVCFSNLKNIGTALEMYSSDNGGLYAPSLAQLTPRYIAEIPLCPCAGKLWEKGRDSYSAAYLTSDDHRTFTVYCRGANHRVITMPDDFPQYDSKSGLIQR
jgi:hypothetical protein